MTLAGPEPSDTAPFDAAELDALFAPVVKDAPRLALAVSGGSDSVALLLLFKEWLAARPQPSVHVLTVDHGLRASSGQEAAAVARLAQDMGWPHATLLWEGPKPRTGLAAAARSARYDLLAAYMQAHAIPLLLTAHTRDDQAETVLMRLARGSGVDGLSAMPPRVVFGDARLVLGRPLLSIPKARLRAAVQVRGGTWSEDPTNEDPAYERPRLRAAQAALSAVGLRPEALAASARRLRRARQALDAITHRFLADPASVHVDPLGYVEISRERLAREPEEIVLRILQAILASVGGAPEPVALRSLEVIAEGLVNGPPDAAWTLARTAVRQRQGNVLFAREPGRVPLPGHPFAAGASIVWDGRFELVAGPRLPQDVEVAALGPEGLGAALAAGLARPAAPARVLHALPALWQAGRLLAVPPLRPATGAELQPDVTARFIGLQRLRAGRPEGAIAP